MLACTTSPVFFDDLQVRVHNLRRLLKVLELGMWVERLKADLLLLLLLLLLGCNRAGAALLALADEVRGIVALCGYLVEEVNVARVGFINVTLEDGLDCVASSRDQVDLGRLPWVVVGSLRLAEGRSVFIKRVEFA